MSIYSPKFAGGHFIIEWASFGRTNCVVAYNVNALFEMRRTHAIFP